MNNLQQFVIGQKYTNDQIRYALNLENLGGIRPSVGKSSQLQHLAIMTTLGTARKRKQENPYEDRIEDAVLLYTASGKEGDQRLEGKNKRLLEQYSSPVPFFGFANEGRQVYQFLGLLELRRHYKEAQLDKSGNLRSVWIFEFRIHRQPELVPIEHAQSISANLIAESRAREPLAPDDQTVVIIRPPEKDRERVTFVEAEQVRSTLLAVNPFKFEHLLQSFSYHVRVSRRDSDKDLWRRRHRLEWICSR